MNLDAVPVVQRKIDYTCLVSHSNKLAAVGLRLGRTCIIMVTKDIGREIDRALSLVQLLSHLLLHLVSVLTCITISLCATDHSIAKS